MQGFITLIKFTILKFKTLFSSLTLTDKIIKLSNVKAIAV